MSWKGIFIVEIKNGNDKFPKWQKINLKQISTHGNNIFVQYCSHNHWFLYWKELHVLEKMLRYKNTIKILQNLTSTGRYPSEFLLLLNLFLTIFAKSRASSPEVVCNCLHHPFYFISQHTGVAYSCIACLSLCFFAVLWLKKQFWQRSRLKQYRQR